jgi:ABC-2 type transport system permease protein
MSTATAPTPASAAAPGYRARRTLPFRVEAIRQFRRRRTLIAFGILLILPWVLVGAFEISGPASGGNGTPGLVTAATHGGLNFTAFSFFVSAGFLLVVAVALFCGDTIASEASWSSLRYLLAQPVPRSRLLKQKLIVAGSLCVAANVLLPVWAFVVGGLFFGWSPAQSPIGGSFSSGDSVLRIVVIVGYICIVLMIVASLAFLLSLSVDNPLGAVGGAVMLAVVSTILDQITALGSYRNYLPTHFQYAWIDSLSTPIRYDDMLRGAGLACVYTAIFLGWAWLRFDRKDITS